MMTNDTTTSYIDAAAVARDLLADAKVSHGYPGEREQTTARVTLPDGRVASLAVAFDQDSGIGQWFDSSWREIAHHDDVFGVFRWRGRDPETGYPERRPADFDGRARVLSPADNGARIGDPVWWQPPADVSEDDLPRLEKTVRGYLERGDWFHVGLVVTIADDGEETGSASLWGIEWGLDDPNGNHAAFLVETVDELLIEAGIESPSTAGVARWARDPLEAVARRISGEDPDSPPAPAYDSTLADLLRWWHDVVEPAGDWDAYGDRLTNAIESDYASHLRAVHHGHATPPPGRSLGVSYGDDCTFCTYGSGPYSPHFHHADQCPRRTREA